jgi:diaminopimelate decarboxylase
MTTRPDAGTQLSRELLIKAADQFGVPVYVYHAEKIKEQFNKLQSALDPANARLFYACKALTNINILKYIRSIGCNIDCSSSNEVLLAIEAGFAPKQILYTSNNVDFRELDEVASKGVNINVDNLSALLKFGNKYGSNYPVGVRLRPNIMAGGNLKISTGHDNSKFGIPLEQVDEILKISGQTGLIINGLHLHTGSEIKDVEVFVQGVELLFKLSDKFPHLEFLDLGGGFKVKYKAGDHETDIELLGKRLAESLAGFEKSSGRKLKLWFEPGKYLVSEAGYLIASVNVIKKTSSITFAGLNTGLNHLIRPMFYDAWHTIDNISNPSGEVKEYTITGYICETDTFGANRDMNDIREGDYLVFRNAGAYGFEMSSNYNSRFRPAEVLIEGGVPRLIRQAQTMDDLLRGQVF